MSDFTQKQFDRELDEGAFDAFCTYRSAFGGILMPTEVQWEGLSKHEKDKWERFYLMLSRRVLDRAADVVAEAVSKATSGTMPLSEVIRVEKKIRDGKPAEK